MVMFYLSDKQGRHIPTNFVMSTLKEAIAARDRLLEGSPDAVIHINQITIKIEMVE
jgi:hypothetical protein